MWVHAARDGASPRLGRGPRGIRVSEFLG